MKNFVKDSFFYFYFQDEMKLRNKCFTKSHQHQVSITMTVGHVLLVVCVNKCNVLIDFVRQVFLWVNKQTMNAFALVKINSYYQL